MDNNKRGIGDNSTEGKFTSIFEKEAVSEMMRDMKGFAKEAEQLIYKLSDALKKVTTGKDSLTDKQENWNLNVDKYNDWIMEQNPDPRANKKRLRTKYKPAKLSRDEVVNLHTSMSDDLDVMIERVTDVSATVNAYQDPSNFKDWVEVARNGGKSDE
jgi:hypothetical protein